MGIEQAQPLRHIVDHRVEAFVLALELVLSLPQQLVLALELRLQLLPFRYVLVCTYDAAVVHRHAHHGNDPAIREPKNLCASRPEVGDGIRHHSGSILPSIGTSCNARVQHARQSPAGLNLLRPQPVDLGIPAIGDNYAAVGSEQA